MPIIGNDFGSLQANQFNDTAQRQNEYFNYLGAVRAQQAQDDQARARDFQQALAIQDRNDRLMAQQEQRNRLAQERADNIARLDRSALVQGNQELYERGRERAQDDLRRSYFDLEKAAQDRALSKEVASVQNTGQALADSLAEITQDFDKTQTQFRAAQDRLARLNAMAVRAGGERQRSGMYAMPKGVVDVDGSIGKRIELANQTLPGLLNELDQLKQDLSIKARDLSNLKTSVTRSGFLRNQNGVVDAESGRKFDFSQPAPVDVGNARYFDQPPAPVRAAQPQAMQPVPDNGYFVSSAKTPQPSGAWANGFATEPEAPIVDVVTPRTNEEFMMLPIGAIYINPSDGKRYRKTR